MFSRFATSMECENKCDNCHEFCCDGALVMDVSVISEVCLRYRDDLPNGQVCLRCWERLCACKVTALRQMNADK